MGEVRQGGISEGGEDTAEQLSVEEMVERYDGEMVELREDAQAASEISDRVESLKSEINDLESQGQVIANNLRENRDKVRERLMQIAGATYEDESLSELDKAARLIAIKRCTDFKSRGVPQAGPYFTDLEKVIQGSVRGFNELLSTYHGQTVIKVVSGHVVVGRLEGAEVIGVSQPPRYSGSLPEGSLEIEARQAAVHRDFGEKSGTMASGRVFNSTYDVAENTVIGLNPDFLLTNTVIGGPDGLAEEDVTNNEHLYLGNDAVSQLIETLEQARGQAGHQLLYELWVAASVANIDLEELTPRVADRIQRWRTQTRKALAEQAAAISHSVTTGDLYSHHLLEHSERWRPADFMHNARLIETLGLNREEIAAEAIDLLDQVEPTSAESRLAPSMVLALLKPQEEE